MPTFTSDHYVPILKGKLGEFEALGVIPGPVKEGLTPIVEIVSVPWDFEDDVPAKAIEAHLDTAVERLASGWGPEREVFLDSIWIEPDDQADGRHHLEYLFDVARDELLAIPVGGLTRGDEHTAAVAVIAATDGRGACLRVDSDDILDMDSLSDAIDTWLDYAGLEPGSVDLVLDFGELTPNAYNPTLFTARAILPALAHLDDWRTLTVAAGAFPEVLADVKSDSEASFDRQDWQLWNDLRGRDLPRQPAFADYAIAHPGLLDINPRFMRPSASIRYTTDDTWVIVKRQWIRRGFDQFRAASQIVEARPEFADDDHCAGCEFICACAAGGPTGNLTTWRKVGTAHHLTKTTGQIASLP